MRWLSVRVNAMSEGNDFGARRDREAVQDPKRESQAYPEGPAPGGEPDSAPSFRLREATSGGPLWRVPYALVN
jgi:hypothetical protein